ncbi:uncharacterized protein LOC130754302 isoform X1 [Actinidia eriantha]|uniref:uncharacterized protein LOC130754302 isoform X1 n=2 Tax=Actinidia eriantha TaxID=165200 RepID=UPI00258BF125|nr:uncharacterized protein LOC130754302 isoform X1 [Actinidia eriantha]
MAESEAPKPKPRPIVRIGIFLISHSLLLSVLCCTAGVLGLLLLPVLAKNTYISENALMPGSAHPMLSSQDVSQANEFVKEITNLSLKPEGTGIRITGLIAQHMANLGAEVSYHKFHPILSKFHPLHFLGGPDPGIIQENCSCSSIGINAVGIIRAPQGDGKEAIVLVTPYNSVNMSHGEALSLGIASSVFSLVTRVTWLAKDIIWLAADSQHGEYASVADWLRDYHTPLFGGLAKLNAEMCHESSYLYDLKKSPATGAEVSDEFRRAGTMAAALVIKVADRNEEIERDTLSIYAEASNGQMPNLDLVNIVNYLAVHGQGFSVKVEKLWSLLDSKWLKVLGKTFESLGKVAGSFNPQWKFGIPVADYVDGTATLASSLYRQALGVPTGPHGPFRDYQIDAITLEISPKVSSIKKGRQNEFLLRGGRMVEGVIRSVNNLLEKFHQSFFLYLLTSPSKFVSVGVYMIAFALLVAPLPMVAAYLYSDAHKHDFSSEKDKKDELTSSPASVDDPAITFKSWKWLPAAKTVLVVHLWSVIVTLLPYFIGQIPNCTPKNNLLMWVLLSAFSLLALRTILGSSFSVISISQLQKKEWALLKSVTISAAFIGLCLMSVINFATAEIGALLIVPMCLMATPLRFDVKARSLRSITRTACNLVLAFVGFPPTAYLLLKDLFGGFGSVNVGDFWNWAESLWVWNSATYLYVCMVHLPCWVLCVYILLHHC